MHGFPVVAGNDGEGAGMTGQCVIPGLTGDPGVHGFPQPALDPIGGGNDERVRGFPVVAGNDGRVVMLN